MALDLILDNLDNVDDAVKGLYVEKDGKFSLDVAGVPDVSGLKTALASERDAAKKANKLNKELADKFSGIDLDNYNEIIAKNAADEEQRLIDEGKKDEVFEKKMTLRDAEWKKQLDEKAEAGVELEKENAMHCRDKLHSGILIGVSSLKHEACIGDASRMAERLFKLAPDKKSIVMYEDDGETIKVGADGKTPLSVKEWVNSDQVRKEHPNWFVSSAGGSGAFQTTTQIGSKTIARNDFLQLSPIQQSKMIADGVTPID